MIHAVAELVENGIDVRLSVGGTDSRHSPGYLDRLRRMCAGGRHVTFLGYVPESEVPSLFQNAAIAVLPYATITGMSGVAIQSAMYGVPIVASDIPPFRALEREGLRMTFFEWLNKESLKDAIRQLLRSPQAREEDTLRNLEYCQRQRMEIVARKYVDLVEDLVAAGRPGRRVLTATGL